MADGVDSAIVMEINNTIAALALPTTDKKVHILGCLP